MGKVLGVLVILSGVFVAYFLSQNCLTDVKIPPLRDEYFGTGDFHADDPKIEKFAIKVPDATLEDLQQRLDRTKFFEPLENVKWTYGINTEFLRKVQTHWRNTYDWRKHEGFSINFATLNKFDHFKTEIEGIKVHYIRAKPPAGKYKNVQPLLLVHGWPGSVWEFHKIIPMLTDPPAGLLPKDAPKDLAFEVIAPSIPGYGWSDKPRKAGFSPFSCGRVFGKLMERLKLDKYYLQGGDWGAIITTTIAQMFPDRVNGLHLNMLYVGPTAYPLLLVQQVLGSFFPSIAVHPNDYDKVYPMSEKFLFILQESGYMHIQATKPDTVGFALQDSPMGLAAYILEKFSTWTHPSYREFTDGGLTRHWTLDELLTNVMIYWVTDTIASSQRFYKECFAHPEFDVYEKGSFDDLLRAPVHVPTGAAAFPHELALMPRNLLAYKYRNITRFTDMPRGGHFAAFQEPKLLAADVFGFVGDLEK